MKTFNTFDDLSLPAPFYGALKQMGFITPTPVQAASLPPALEGKDILGTAQTGTGKTGAFGIPLLAKLHSNPGSRALILAPTRELAAQIHKVLAQMSVGTKLKGALLVGGEPFLRQKTDVKDGADYYVCTPGRLIDHLDAGLKLNKVCVLVLDEVDRMLDMGFAPQLMQIVPHIPSERQTLLFSATLPKEILAVAGKYLTDPVRVSIGATTQPIDRVKQENHRTTHLQKSDLLLSHLKAIQGRVLIFARTQHRTNKVFQMLERNKFSVVSLHGGRTQGQRKEALKGFHGGTHLIMVATDLAGRGIDVDDIEVVINYDLPMNREDYIHRIGRTGRNGKAGTAFNYLTPNDHDGKGIISPHQPRAGKPQPSAPAQKTNKPGWSKGGWERTGGRNRPEFSRRKPEDGYGRPGEKPAKHKSPPPLHQSPEVKPADRGETKHFSGRPHHKPNPFAPRRPGGRPPSHPSNRTAGRDNHDRPRTFGAKPVAGQAKKNFWGERPNGSPAARG